MKVTIKNNGDRQYTKFSDENFDMHYSQIVTNGKFTINPSSIGGKSDFIARFDTWLRMIQFNSMELGQKYKYSGLEFSKAEDLESFVNILIDVINGWYKDTPIVSEDTLAYTLSLLSRLHSSRTDVEKFLTCEKSKVFILHQLTSLPQL